MPHLVVSISGHGFGHVTQTAPILNQLYKYMPELNITVRSAVPHSYLRSRIQSPFIHLMSEGDIGMVMTSALDVDVEKSRAAYRAFHTEWHIRVEREAKFLKEIGADVVFSNVGYLPLAGAQRAGIKNVALCSLNWADIYRHYCGDDSIALQIRSCYANSDAFFRITPGMAMTDLPNLVSVTPYAIVGSDCREKLDIQLNLSKDEKLVLVSLGGVASRLPIESWPHIDSVRWLVQENWQVTHTDAITLESLMMDFNDLLSSCDALLCKPGYGCFVEAACSGIPVLYVNRPDWPEAPALVDWLKQHGVCREVSRKQLEDGEIAQSLGELWGVPAVARPESVGTAQVVDSLIHRLLT